MNIDADGNAAEPSPAAAATFKQGMNGYRSANLGLYSRAKDAMHTLLLGGISYQYFDRASGQILNDQNLPFTSDATDVMTTADGVMKQYLLPSTYPDLLSSNTGLPLLLGTETEFFLADGVATFSNGVIDLDALPAGRNLVGWLYGGIAAEQPNNGPTFGSNAVFPVYITVPEPATTGLFAVAATIIVRGRRRRF